jgi:hypothetical protein
VAKDISRDGQAILFEDSSEAAGSNYSLAIRKIDGTPPIQLGEGSAGGLSPDGEWAISILPGKPGQVKLIPIGPGQVRTIATPGLEIENGNARVLADGKRITLSAKEPGRAPRTYAVDLDGGKPVPITPEGISNGLVSTNGLSIVRADEAGIVSVYPTSGPTSGETSRAIPGLEAGFVPIRWSEDDSAVYGYRPGQVPAKVYKVNVTSGEKTLIQEIQPESTVGVVTIQPVVMNRDGSRFAYSYYQVFSVLYLISGLQ